jgi:hypothetical protein
MTFDGSGLPSGSTSSLVFVVVQLDDPHPAASCFEHVLAWGSAQPGAARIIHKGCETPWAFTETYGTYTAMKPTRPWPVGRMAMLSANITKHGVDVRMNGSPDYSWKAPANVPTNTVPQKTAMIGGAPWWGAQAGWPGLIGEVIVLSGEISTTERGKVEQYLIRKWNIHEVTPAKPSVRPHATPLPRGRSRSCCLSIDITPRVPWRGPVTGIERVPIARRSPLRRGTCTDHFCDKGRCRVMSCLPSRRHQPVPSPPSTNSRTWV